MNVKELVVLNTPEMDGDLITELVEPPPVALDLSRFPSLSDFTKDIAGPSQKEKIERRKQVEKKNAEIRA
jgi:hypothetical protein